MVGITDANGNVTEVAGGSGNFISDPLKANLDASNLGEVDVESWRKKLNSFIELYTGYEVQNSPTSYGIITILKELHKQGDNLTWSNNQIIIGKNVSRIKITGQIQTYNNVDETRFYFAIYQNNSIVESSENYVDSTNKYNVDLYPFVEVVDVVEGDTIDFRFCSGNTANNVNQRTRFLVEVI